jgi:hypothetical protein
VICSFNTDESASSDMSAIPGQPEEMFVKILSFLNTKDLKNCRTVNSKWDQVILSEIMKRTTLVMGGNVPVNQRYISSKFSSWTVSFQNDEQMIRSCLSEYGSHLRHLSINEFPITGNSIAWLTGHFIPRSCPDLLELQLTPLEKQDHTVENFEAIKVFAGAYNGTSELAAEDSPFQRFHKDYANVHTLRFDGKWEREWEPLIHLVLMACPSIRHVYMNCRTY